MIRNVYPAKLDDTEIMETENITKEEAVTRAIDIINHTRDSLIEGGFVHNGHSFQSRQSDRENISVLGQLATMMVMGGVAVADNLRWADANNDFGWITADNTVVPMDAFAMAALFQKGLAFKSSITFYARYLKNVILEMAEDEEATIQDMEDLLENATWPT